MQTSEDLTAPIRGAGFNQRKGLRHGKHGSSGGA